MTTCAEPRHDTLAMASTKNKKNGSVKSVTVADVGVFIDVYEPNIMWDEVNMLSLQISVSRYFYLPA